MLHTSVGRASVIDRISGPTCFVLLPFDAAMRYESSIKQDSAFRSESRIVPWNSRVFSMTRYRNRKMISQVYAPVGGYDNMIPGEQVLRRK